MSSVTLEIQGLNPPGQGDEEDAGGFAKNVSRFSMCVPNAWWPVVAARRSQRTAFHQELDEVGKTQVEK